MLPELIPVWLKYFVALHDNSPAFEEFLEKEGVDEAALKFGLRRKIEHTIVPHVCPLCLLSASESAHPIVSVSGLGWETRQMLCHTFQLIVAGTGM